MCKKTHAEFAQGFAILSCILFDILFPNFVHFYILAILTTIIANKFAKFQDYDQNWNVVSEKTTLSRIINKIVVITGGTHRSKQTHALDLVLCRYALSFYLVTVAGQTGVLSLFEVNLVRVMLFGAFSGELSHLIADMFNGDGIWLSIFSKKKTAIVPKKIGKFRFNTGGAWEKFFYLVCYKFNRVLEVIAVLYPVLKIQVFRAFVAGTWGAIWQFIANLIS